MQVDNLFTALLTIGLASALFYELYQVDFATTKGNFKLDNIKRGASIIGSAGSGKTESVVYGFLKHFRKEGFCGIIHDYKDFELTEMAYPLFKDGDIPFKVISFDKIIHRVNPIAPRYLENEESVNEVSRVLIENLLEQRESGTTGTTKFFNDAAEGLIGGLIWKLKTTYPQFCTLPHIPKLSTKVLSHELKDMEVNQLITRIVINGYPVRTEYRPTEYSYTLKKIILELQNWGVTHRKKIFG